MSQHQEPAAAGEAGKSAKVQFSEVLLDLVRRVHGENIGCLDLRMDDVWISGENSGSWLLKLQRENAALTSQPTPVRASVKGVESYVLAPREPTDVSLDAGIEALPVRIGGNREFERERMARVYRAMVAVITPRPETAGAGGGAWLDHDHVSSAYQEWKAGKGSPPLPGPAFEAGFLAARQILASTAPAADGRPGREEIAGLERVCDSAYSAGLTKGWNLCVADDNEGFARIKETYRYQRSDFAPKQPAGRGTDEPDAVAAARAFLARLDPSSTPDEHIANLRRRATGAAHAPEWRQELTARADAIEAALRTLTTLPDPLAAGGQDKEVRS